MKIIYKKGDLLQASENYIMHGCNAQGVMGSGVAKAIKEQHPIAFKQYREIYEAGLLKLGDVDICPSNGKGIINAVTQNLYGRTGSRFVSYDAIAEVMEKTNACLSGEAVAMPKIGAGLGGGDWRIIEAIIESCMTNCQPVVYEL